MYRTMLTAVLFAGLACGQALMPRLVRFDGIVPRASGQVPVTFTFYAIRRTVLSLSQLYWLPPPEFSLRAAV
jgi:hypothetical protein